MKDAENVLVALERSSLVQGLWKNYQRRFPYTADYAWADIIQSARELAFKAGLPVNESPAAETQKTAPDGTVF